MIDELTVEEKVLSDRIREEGAQGLGWLSVNRYGSVCLNSPQVFFSDVDCLPNPRRPGKSVVEWDMAVQLAERVIKEDGLQLRCYRTHSGIRLLETSRFWVGDDPYTLDVLRRLGTDSAYVHLTKNLNNFRVRLTPKPWRIPESDLIDFKAEGALERYLHQGKYRIAAYVGTLGRESVEMPPEIAEVVTLHDEYCRSYDETLSLA